MIIQAAVIAAQLLFDMQHRLIGALISIPRVSLRAQYNAGVEVERTFGMKPGTFAFDCGMAGIAAVEIFVQRPGDAGLDAAA